MWRGAWTLWCYAGHLEVGESSFVEDAHPSMPSNG